MEAFLDTWGFVIGQATLLVGIVAAFGVGIAPHVGARRRVENLKLGAEALEVLKDAKDIRAVEGFMARERFLLEDKIVMSGRSFVAMGVLLFCVIVFAPLVRMYADPAPDPDPWQMWGTTLAALGVLAAYLAGVVYARRLANRKRAERQAQEANLADQAVR
ncbi:hypothetical protein [Cryobacterium sp. AP23]